MKNFLKLSRWQKREKNSKGFKFKPTITLKSGDASIVSCVDGLKRESLRIEKINAQTYSTLANY